VFDVSSRLLKTIRKARKAVALSDAFPPIKDIIALGDKWLFVQTYEKPNEGSAMYDIFDTNGKFIGRTEVDGYQIKFKGDRVYYLKQ
jgi:hypothetical protein